MAADTPAAAPLRGADARRPGRVALLLVVGAGLLTFSYAPAGLVLAGVALVLAIRALVRASRQRTGSTAALVAVSAAPVVLLVAGVLTAAQLVFADELGRYRDCTAGANTRTAQTLCQQQLRDDLTRRL